jgi:hypothetical protein
VILPTHVASWGCVITDACKRRRGTLTRNIVGPAVAERIWTATRACSHSDNQLFALDCREAAYWLVGALKRLVYSAREEY